MFYLEIFHPIRCDGPMCDEHIMGERTRQETHDSARRDNWHLGRDGKHLCERCADNESYAGRLAPESDVAVDAPIGPSLTGEIPVAEVRLHLGAYRGELRRAVKHHHDGCECKVCWALHRLSDTIADLDAAKIYRWRTAGRESQLLSIDDAEQCAKIVQCANPRQTVEIVECA